MLPIEKAVQVAALALQDKAHALRGYDYVVIVAASDGKGDVGLFSSFPEGEQVKSTLRRLIANVWERGRIIVRGFEQ